MLSAACEHKDAVVLGRRTQPTYVVTFLELTIPMQLVGRKMELEKE